MNPIPDAINEVYRELKTEITWLHGRWIIYRQLFAGSEERIELLNECASTFFHFVHEVLLSEVQVTLSKLTDPARQGGFDNLSLDQLQHLLVTYGDPGLAAECRALLDELQSKCEPFRTWRNKRLAHLDLTTAMKSGLDPLPGISRQMVEDALAIVRDYMNKIEGHYSQSKFAYEHFLMRSDDC